MALTSLQAYATVEEDGKEGHLSIKGTFNNHAQTDDASVHIEIFGPDKQLVHKEKKRINEFTEQELLSFSIAEPKLWSPDYPNLYACKITLVSSTGTMVNEEKFGFRHFEFKTNGPFHLNGERLLLRGTHRHEDHAGVGPAMTEEMIIKEMEMMKEMGVNFIRWAITNNPGSC